jgi:hypothetical protein
MGALLAGGLLAAPALAVNPGEMTRGMIVSTDWSANKITVKHPQGWTMGILVSPSTRVVFSDGAEYFPHPTYKDLAAGMYVYFRFTTEVADEIEVREIPQGARRTPGPAPARPSKPESRVIKVRILSLDERRGELRAEVAGRTESFRVAEPRMLRRFSAGDLAILTLETRGRDEVVTSIQSAAESGRVIRVDQRRGEIVIEVNGRQETYRIDDRRLLDRVRVGDRVRFEFEERPRGLRVITGIY